MLRDKKYQCGSCEQQFDRLKDDSCPYCGSGNYVIGCIDEPLPPNCCEKCGEHFINHNDDGSCIED